MSDGVSGGGMTDRPLKILFVTPECAPWVKTGGLGDVSSALPAALTTLGHDVRVLMPAYKSLSSLAKKATHRTTVPAQGGWPAATLLKVDDETFSLWLLDCPSLYDHAGGPYGDEWGTDHPDNDLRFAFLSHVAARIASGATPWHGMASHDEGAWRADVLHAHDWPTGLAAAYLKRKPRPHARSIFTIHNMAFQGNFPAHRAKALHLPADWMKVEGGLLHWDQISMMKGALSFADVITTVSPTYAREIQEEKLGFGMDGMLRYRSHDLHGILNGIDTQVWNPAIDPLIPSRYDASTLEKKAANKAGLQARLRLAVRPEPLVFGVVSRLTTQKGIDLILANLEWIVAQDAQIAVLGSGDARFELQLRRVAADNPEHIAVSTGFDESMAHLIEAGADCFLMPSRFEPCGLNQMYSQAYGTLPIVRATGGLADSVRDADAPDGTGFVFTDDTPEGLRATMDRALQTYGRPAAWRELQQRAMREHFGWADSAARYVEVYRGGR